MKKIIYEGGNQPLTKMLQSPFFSALSAAFEQEPTLTLRELKTRINDVKIERKIDYLVKMGIISREARRYFLKLPDLTEKEKSPYFESVKQELQAFARNQTEAKRLLLLSALYPQQTLPLPFILSEDLPFCFCEKASNDLLEVVTFSTHPHEFCLPRYFNRTQCEDERLIFSSIEALIGDVDPDYYLDQVWALLEKIQGQRRRIRENIFLQSLKEFGIITQTDRWVLEVPIYSMAKKEQSELDYAIMESYKKLSLFEQRELLGELMQEWQIKVSTLLFINEE
ncbi:DUF1803 domain-containing protein [Enterococcus sp. LJL98]